MKNRLPFLTLLFVCTFFLTGCIVEADDDPEIDFGSVEFVFSMSDAVINGDVASSQFNVPAINRAVVNNGAVLAYFREQGTWTAMPFTFAVESPELPAVDYTITMGFGFDEGFLEVFYEASSEAANLEDQPDRFIKVVILDDLSIPAIANLDLSDYNQVKQTLQLD